MATVPVYDPRIGVPDAPTVRTNVQADASMFGGLEARAMQGVGQDVQQVAGQAAQYAARQQAEAERKQREGDAEAAKDALITAREKAMPVLTSYLSMQGKDAADAAPEVTSKLQGIYAESANGLTVRAKQLVTPLIREDVMGHANDIQKHSTQQLTRYQDTQDSALIGQASMHLVSHASNDDVIASDLAQIRAASNSTLSRQGVKDPKMLDTRYAALEAESLTKAFDAHVAQGDMGGAVSFLDRYGARLGAGKIQADAVLKTWQEKQVVLAKAQAKDNLVGGYMSAIQDPNMINSAGQRTNLVGMIGAGVDSGIIDKTEAATLMGHLNSAISQQAADVKQQNNELDRARLESVTAQLNSMKVAFDAGAIDQATYRQGVAGLLTNQPAGTVPAAALPAIGGAFTQLHSAAKGVEGDAIKWLHDQSALGVFGDRNINDKGQDTTMADRRKEAETALAGKSHWFKANETPAQMMTILQKKWAVQDSYYNTSLKTAKDWLQKNPDKTLEDFQMFMRQTVMSPQSAAKAMQMINNAGK